MKSFLKVLITFVLLLVICLPITINANTAAPIIGEDGTGIIFEKNEKIKINKEILDRKSVV